MRLTWTYHQKEDLRNLGWDAVGEIRWISKKFYAPTRIFTLTRLKWSKDTKQYSLSSPDIYRGVYQIEKSKSVTLTWPSKIFSWNRHGYVLHIHKFIFTLRFSEPLIIISIKKFTCCRHSDDSIGFTQDFSFFSVPVFHWNQSSHAGYSMAEIWYF